MNTRTTLIWLLVGTVLLASTGLVAAQQGEIRVDGEPDLDVYLPQNTVTPGEVNELTLQIVNEGELKRGQETNRELVTTARNVVLEVDDDDIPITVTTGRTSVGTVTENAPTEVPIEIEVPDAAEPGTYEIDVDIEYRFTDRVRQTESITDQNQRSRSVTKEIEIEVDDGARFRVTNVNSTLRVNEDGEITGEIQNIGGQDATNAEVRFPTEHENIFPRENAVAVGDVPAGESAAFRIPVEVGSEAEAVSKRFELPVSFRDENGIRTTDDNPEFLAAIAAERETFTIEPVDREITAGETTRLEFTITNNRDETLTDIEPKLFTDSPFSSTDDEAFVQSLDPGESTTIAFELSAAGTASAKAYPVTLDVRYEDGAGKSQITDSYRIGMNVLEAGDSGLLGSIGTIIVAIASILAVGGGYVWYRGQ